MFDDQVPRRGFLTTAGRIALALPFTSLAGCNNILDRIRDRPTRRNLVGMDPSDPMIDSYRAAVAAMKALPSSDPRSWTRQAQIHNDHCPHGNWYFLPWHRAYLLYFERICRTLSGNPDFALPYWNWTDSPIIPAPFWGGPSNSLFDSSRVATASSTISDVFVGESVMESILAEPNFFLFASGKSSAQRERVTSGRLEATPHNNVHVFVGGNMASYMSPLDPVFWTHHNMIDCCWVEWNIHRSNDNTDDTSWVDHEFTEFVDESGAAVAVSVAATILMPLLSYQFERCAPGERPVVVMTPDDVEAARIRLEEGAPRRFDVRTRSPRAQGTVLGPNARATVPIDMSPTAVLAEADDTDRLVLEVGDVTPPPTGELVLHVFLNGPAAEQGVPMQTPGYVASIAFFVDEEHAAEPGSYVFDLSTAVARLRDAGSDLQSVTVQLRTEPRRGRQSNESLRIGYLQVGVLSGD